MTEPELLIVEMMRRYINEKELMDDFIRWMNGQRVDGKIIVVADFSSN